MSARMFTYVCAYISSWSYVYIFMVLRIYLQALTYIRSRPRVRTRRAESTYSQGERPLLIFPYLFFTTPFIRHSVIVIIKHSDNQMLRCWRILTDAKNIHQSFVYNTLNNNGLTLTDGKWWMLTDDGCWWMIFCHPSAVNTHMLSLLFLKSDGWRRNHKNFTRI